MFVVLAKPVDQAFVLNPEKAEEFLARKGDPKIKEMILKRAEKFRKNMIRDDRFKNIAITNCDYDINEKSS